jgi:predicted glycoside hydrolase/deacetylase ChbG (UPF0249 family)
MNVDAPNTPPSVARRYLIVNADDFGRNNAVNAAVAESFRRGIVTSTSIVATGPAFDQAVDIAQELPELGVGIHLAATEYIPTLPSASIPSLVNSEGRFYSRGEQFRKMARHPGMRKDLLLEWNAQISKVVKAGIKLTHIDGHGHCHAHPAAASVVLVLAQRYGIKNVRLPAEPIGWKPGRSFSSRFLAKAVLNLASQVARRKWQGKLRFPQSFYGFSHGGGVTPDVVRDVAKSVRPGVSELMVHVATSKLQLPGYRTKFDFTVDFRGVTAYSKPEFEREFGVALVTYEQAARHISI